MEGNYEVYLGKDSVGRVLVSREGLYLRFLCRCNLSGEVVCRLSVSCGGKEENLGVLVPEGDRFGLETKLPAKKLGQGTPTFCVLPNRVAAQEKFVPIYPEEPFAYIDKLKKSFLARKNGVLGAVILE